MHILMTCIAPARI